MLTLTYTPDADVKVSVGYSCDEGCVSQARIKGQTVDLSGVPYSSTSVFIEEYKNDDDATGSTDLLTYGDTVINALEGQHRTENEIASLEVGSPSSPPGSARGSQLRKFPETPSLGEALRCYVGAATNGRWVAVVLTPASGKTTENNTTKCCYAPVTPVDFGANSGVNRGFTQRVWDASWQELARAKPSEKCESDVAEGPEVYRIEDPERRLQWCHESHLMGLYETQLGIYEAKLREVEREQSSANFVSAVAANRGAQHGGGVRANYSAKLRQRVGHMKTQGKLLAIERPTPPPSVRLNDCPPATTKIGGGGARLTAMEEYLQGKAEPSGAGHHSPGRSAPYCVEDVFIKQIAAAMEEELVSAVPAPPQPVLSPLVASPTMRRSSSRKISVEGGGFARAEVASAAAAAPAAKPTHDFCVLIGSLGSACYYSCTTPETVFRLEPGGYSVGVVSEGGPGSLRSMDLLGGSGGGGGGDVGQVARETAEAMVKLCGGKGGGGGGVLCGAGIALAETSTHIEHHVCEAGEVRQAVSYCLSATPLPVVEKGETKTRTTRRKKVPARR